MRIISRAEWGAPPVIAGRMGAVKRMFLHHTATGNSGDERADMRRIRQIGLNRGFADISYSFIVFPSGNIYEGRGWGRVGAHTSGFNSTSYAISLAGNYETQPMTDAQVNACQWIIAEGTRRGYLARAGLALFGHRDVRATACPGRNAYARLDAIRSGVPIVTGPAPSPAPIPRPAPPALAEWPTMRRGSKGEYVKRLQERLNAHSPASRRISVDGDFGLLTETRVKQFQTAKKLAVDGIVGPATRAALG